MCNELNNPTDFLVTKHTYTYVDCKYCNGTGKKERHFRKMVFVEDCHICKGTGRQRYVMKEEYPLVDALKDLGLYKTEI